MQLSVEEVMAFFNKVADMPLSDFEGVVKKTTSREEVMAFINVSSQAGNESKRRRKWRLILRRN